MSIYDNDPALPSSSKQDGPIPNVPANQRWASAEWNALVTKVQQTVDAIVGNIPNWLALKQNSSPPSGAANLVPVHSDGSNIFFNPNNAGIQLLSPTWFNVKDPRFGAKGDGVTDDTAAFAAVLSAMSAAVQTYNQNPGQAGSVVNYTSPGLHIPGGIYLISAALPWGEIPAVFIGPGATIVQTDPTKDIITGFTTFRSTISGINFRGGRDAIHIDNGDVAGLQVNITECSFSGQARAQIDCDTTMQGQVNCDRCWFNGWENPAAYIFRGITCDGLNFKNCTLQVGMTDAFLIGGGPGVDVVASMEGIDAVSLPVITSTAWVGTHSYSALTDSVLSNGNVYVCVQSGTSAGSGGPSGTGKMIVDGGAKWNFAIGGWVATHAYAVGDYVVNGGHLYQCVHAGTSAGSGGPSGTGQNINDNGVTWSFYVPSWLTCLGGIFRGSNFRFGGEAGRPMARIFSGCGEFQLTKSPTFAASNGPNFIFYGLPAGLTYIDKTFGQGTGCVFDASIPAADWQALAAAGKFRVEGLTDDGGFAEGQTITGASGDPDVINKVKATWDKTRESEPSVTDLVLSIASGFATHAGWFGASNSASNCSTTRNTDRYGLPQVVYSVTTGGLGGASFAQNFTAAMTNAPFGIYTAVFPVLVTGEPAYLQLFAGDQSDFHVLEPGFHLLQVPFALSSTRSSSFTVGYNVNIQDGGTMTIGTIDIYKGRCKLRGSSRRKLLGPAAPVVGYWGTDFEWENTAPSAGGFRGQVVTAAGSPVTGAWPANADVVWGQCCTNDGGKVYFCTQAGHTAGSGGPTGTPFSPLADGSAAWVFYNDGVPTFKNWGAISA